MSTGVKLRLMAFLVLSAVGIVYIAASYLGLVDKALGRGLDGVVGAAPVLAHVPIGALLGAAEAAGLELLEPAGCEVVVPGTQTCCGQPGYNSGDRASALRMVRGVKNRFGAAGAASCFNDQPTICTRQATGCMNKGCRRSTSACRSARRSRLESTNRSPASGKTMLAEANTFGNTITLNSRNFSPTNSKRSHLKFFIRELIKLNPV